MSQNKDLKDCLAKKKVVKCNITKLKEKVINRIELTDISELTLFENKIKILTEELNTVFNNIFCYCDENEIENYIEEQQGVQDVIDDLWLEVNRKNSKLNLIENSNDSNSSKVRVPEVKLPKLNLPTFSGNLDEWLAFYDLFQASVHNNTTLSSCQKLQYLKSSCRGDALKIIQSIPISDNNYEIALDLLKERYSNTRELVNALIKKLVSMQNMSDTTQSILHGVDVISECIRSLQVLNQDICGFSDTLIVYLVTEKLDKNTRCWWERTLKTEEMGTLDNLLIFLKDHARTLQNSKMYSKEIRKVPYHKFTTLVTHSDKCFYCKESHALYKCTTFLQLNVQKRIDFVKKNNLCFNCLSGQHIAKYCKNNNTCKVCNRFHHSILHISKNDRPSSDATNGPTSDIPLSPQAAEFHPKPSDLPSQAACTSTFCSPGNSASGDSSVGTKQTLLCTALIKIIDSAGNFVTCRALLDSGSEASFISEDCLRTLGLEKNNNKAQITCLGSYNAPTSGEVQLSFTPHFNTNLKFCTRAFVIRKITSDIPSVAIPNQIVTHFNDLVLADPLFFESRPVDVLLGVNVFFTMLKGDIMKRDEKLPFAVSSKLGWIISGTTCFNNCPQQTFSVNNIQLSTHELVEKFWELDSVPEIKNNMPEIDKRCEEHFQNTHFRDDTGRYVVELPFKESPSCLGDSRELALQRFLALERKLVKAPEIYKLYKAFMKEYLDLNHMELVKNLKCSENCYYIPHHHVMKESSTTTKLRVVFNASTKSSSGISLNDILMVGPRIQQELFPILLRFRFFPIVITADIMKMFRQILITNADRDFQRVFWRDSPDKPIEEYRLSTVTYGTTPAPFLATRSIYQLALDEANNFPLASKVALKDFYVDDLLSGSSNVENCKELVKQLICMMEKGGFVLRKWASNDPTVLECIPVESRDSSNSTEIINSTGIKILGINWIPRDDYFHFSVSPIPEKINFTKRDILSDLAKLFDPLGWLAPCIIYLKILVQNMWKISLSWDEPIPEEIARKWIFFRQELSFIEKLKIPRFVLLSNSAILDIHAFCDSSEKAYCTVIYIRSTFSNTDVKVSLLTSKTRVAPLKVQSLPRLELCSAVLLSNLLQAVLKYLEMPIRDIFAWSDSTVVLSWISSESYRWVPFVANRVEKIKSAIPSVKWKYISGKQNPADCATRGLFPSDFLNCELWFHGPAWLYQSDSEMNGFLNENIVVNDDEIRSEERKIYHAATCTIQVNELFERYSSWSKLRRIVTLCLRFIHNCRNPSAKRIRGFITSEELRIATMIIIKKVQHSYFFEEINCLKSDKELSAHCKILPLTPFLDSEGLLRVGGRLKNANIPKSQKFPILIPKKCHVTNLIIMYYHITYLHAAQELLLGILRMQFWILSGRSEVRKIVHRCLPCVKNRGKTASQLMADLPPTRVQPSRPFTITGVDYAGAFLIKSRSGRGVKTLKCYISIFVCFSTKAIHLELVSDLSTTTFLAALKRFISRRGKPSKIASDCGTNFKKASKELKEIYKFASGLEKSDEVTKFISSEGITWDFNPPAAPHFGGIWESNIKCVKFHLKRVIGSTMLTYEEFITLLTQVEACLNSRPLCAMSSDPNDLQVLTPGHFLIGAPLVAIPERDLTDISISKLKRWELVQQMLQHLWKRWNTEYISTLQQKCKWFRSNSNLKIGDLVIIKHEQLSPCLWKIGRVTEIHPGSDGRIRVVTVTTSTGQVKRPITKLCPLPIEQ